MRVDNTDAHIVRIDELICEEAQLLGEGCNRAPTHVLFDFGTPGGLYCEEHGQMWVERIDAERAAWTERIDAERAARAKPVALDSEF